MFNSTDVGRRSNRPMAGLIAVSMALPLMAGCGGPSNSGANAPPVDDTRGGTTAPAPPANTQNTGMTTKQKVVLVAGAAALYWLYKHQKNEQGQPVTYYQSKNGRVYYRDANHQAHWVTPPTQVTVSDQEAQDLSRYQGYNNQSSGERFTGFQQDSSQ